MKLALFSALGIAAGFVSSYAAGQPPRGDLPPPAFPDRLEVRIVDQTDGAALPGAWYAVQGPGRSWVSTPFPLGGWAGPAGEVSIDLGKGPEICVDADCRMLGQVDSAAEGRVYQLRFAADGYAPVEMQLEPGCCADGAAASTRSGVPIVRAVPAEVGLRPVAGHPARGLSREPRLEAVGRWRLNEDNGWPVLGGIVLDRNRTARIRSNAGDLEAELEFRCAPISRNIRLGSSAGSLYLTWYEDGKPSVRRENVRYAADDRPARRLPEMAGDGFEELVTALRGSRTLVLSRGNQRAEFDTAGADEVFADLFTRCRIVEP